MEEIAKEFEIENNDKELTTKEIKQSPSKISKEKIANLFISEYSKEDVFFFLENLPFEENSLKEIQKFVKNGKDLLSLYKNDKLLSKLKLDLHSRTSLLSSIEEEIEKQLKVFLLLKDNKTLTLNIEYDLKYTLKDLLNYIQKALGYNEPLLIVPTSNPNEILLPNIQIAKKILMNPNKYRNLKIFDKKSIFGEEDTHLLSNNQNNIPSYQRPGEYIIKERNISKSSVDLINPFQPKEYTPFYNSKKSISNTNVSTNINQNDYTKNSNYEYQMTTENKFSPNQSVSDNIIRTSTPNLISNKLNEDISENLKLFNKEQKYNKNSNSEKISEKFYIKENNNNINDTNNLKQELPSYKRDDNLYKELTNPLVEEKNNYLYKITNSHTIDNEDNNNLKKDNLFSGLNRNYKSGFIIGTNQYSSTNKGGIEEENIKPKFEFNRLTQDVNKDSSSNIGKNSYSYVPLNINNNPEIKSSSITENNNKYDIEIPKTEKTSSVGGSDVLKMLKNKYSTENINNVNNNINKTENSTDIIGINNTQVRKDYIAKTPKSTEVRRVIIDNINNYENDAHRQINSKVNNNSIINDITSKYNYLEKENNYGSNNIIDYNVNEGENNNDRMYKKYQIEQSKEKNETKNISTGNEYGSFQYKTSGYKSTFTQQKEYNPYYEKLTEQVTNKKMK